MAKQSYDQALAWVLAHEGGYSNDPADPGGPTNFGITIKDYRAYVKPGATAADVKAMRLDDAKAIYRSKYWAAMRCDELPVGLDYAVFDYGVNSGTGRAIAVLRRLLGIAGDGSITDETIAAAGRCDVTGVITQLCDERLAFLKRLKTWPVFGVGWSRRVADVRSAALAMAGESAAGKVVAPLKTAAQKKAAGAIVVSGVIVAQQAHQNGARPLFIITSIVIAAGLAVAGWALWRWHRQRQQLASTPGEHL